MSRRRKFDGTEENEKNSRFKNVNVRSDEMNLQTEEKIEKTQGNKIIPSIEGATISVSSDEMWRHLKFSVKPTFSADSAEEKNDFKAFLNQLPPLPADDFPSDPQPLGGFVHGEHSLFRVRKEKPTKRKTVSFPDTEGYKLFLKEDQADDLYDYAFDRFSAEEGDDVNKIPRLIDRLETNFDPDAKNMVVVNNLIMQAYLYYKLGCKDGKNYNEKICEKILYVAGIDETFVDFLSDLNELLEGKLYPIVPTEREQISDEENSLISSFNPFQSN